MVETILNATKKKLGIVPEYNVFDDQLLLDINTAFSILHQLGVGPDEGIEVDETTTWDVVVTQPRLNMIKSFVYIKVRLMFNPPSSSFALNEMTKELDELTWRIKSEIACYGQ